jgi:hypothetical protein
VTRNCWVVESLPALTILCSSLNVATASSDAFNRSFNDLSRPLSQSAASSVASVRLRPWLATNASAMALA